jgi:hypothetical protein
MSNSDEEKELSGEAVVFKISISSREFYNLVDNGKDDPRQKNAVNLQADWVKLFTAQIKEYEPDVPSGDVKLGVSMSRVYKNAKRSDTAFFKGTAKCLNCPPKHCNYSFTIQTEPARGGLQLEVTAKRSAVHDHKREKPKQIRGKDRSVVATAVISQTNGSTRNFLDLQAGKYY